jgi:hypothetical protein
MATELWFSIYSLLSLMYVYFLPTLHLMADNINMNDNDNNNSTNTNTNTADVDIFAPPLPVIEDKKAITLKCKVNELCRWLQAMVEVMPIVDDKTLLEKEEWCQQWKHLIVSDSFLFQIY